MIQFDSFMQAEGVPIYQQIIRYVKQGIAAGTIRDGEELPSRRVLSALTMLQVDGAVQEHPGRRFSSLVVLEE